MVERFNGRLEQVLRSHHFNSAEDLQSTLLRYVWLYNHHLPQKALGHECPVRALKRWQKSYPDLFSRQVRNRTGPDIQPAQTLKQWRAQKPEFFVKRIYEQMGLDSHRVLRSFGL
jgi:transposase InsO family protein